MKVKTDSNIIRSIYCYIRNKYITIYPSDVISALINDNDFNNFVEVGVWKGENLLQVTKKSPGLRELYGIDPYRATEYKVKKNSMAKISQKEMDKIYLEVFERFKYELRTEIIRKTGKKGAEMFPDESVDFVYIDDNHEYETVKENIKAWLPKVRKGGIMAGHDYKLGQIGVIKAVTEAFGIDAPNIESDNIWWVRK